MITLSESNHTQHGHICSEMAGTGSKFMWGMGYRACIGMRSGWVGLKCVGVGFVDHLCFFG